jgi:hypothetical protein
MNTYEYNSGWTKDIRLKKRFFIHHEETNRINSRMIVGCTYVGWMVGRIDRCLYGYPLCGHNCFFTAAMQESGKWAGNLVEGGRSQQTLMRVGCGGLAGRVHSRYPGEGWGRYGEVTSHSRTLRTVQNAARTTDVRSGMSWSVKKEMISENKHRHKAPHLLRHRKGHWHNKGHH